MKVSKKIINTSTDIPVDSYASSKVQPRPKHRKAPSNKSSSGVLGVPAAEVEQSHHLANDSWCFNACKISKYLKKGSLKRFLKSFKKIDLLVVGFQRTIKTRTNIDALLSFYVLGRL